MARVPRQIQIVAIFWMMMMMQAVAIYNTMMRHHFTRRLTRRPYRNFRAEREVALNRMFGLSDRVCHEMLRMKIGAFQRLCGHLRGYGLTDSRFMRVEEQVAIFLSTVGHDHRSRMGAYTFFRSSQTVSYYFHRVLNACLALYRDVVINATAQNSPYDKGDEGWYHYFQDAVGAIDGTHIAGPKRTEKGFKSEEFTKVIEKVREACHISISVDNVRGRLRMLKKECDDITELFKTSGFGLDSSGQVSADPITWETYIKEKPDGAKMKGKLCPRYYDLLTVFGNDAATGDRAISGNDFPPMSEPVDDLEGKNDVEETQPSHSTNSHRSVQGGPPQRRKRTKPMEDAALALAKIAKSSEMIAVAFDKQAVAFDKQASQNYVNGQALLERLKEMNIDQGDIMDLMEVFEGDEKAGKFFLEITDVEFRRLWVYRKLGRDPPR